MKALDKIDLKRAGESFAVANTPLFLIHRLRSDPAVQEIARSSTSGKTVLQALKKAISRKPRTLNDAVRPYVYLVVLSMIRDISFLKEASHLEAMHSNWFSYIAGVLLKTYSPTSLETIYAPSLTLTPTANIRTPAPITSSTLTFED